MAPHSSETTLLSVQHLFRRIKQEGTGQVLFFPLALRGKAFGFNGLC
jgi:hypothetical protein